MPETVVHFQVRMAPTLHERLATRAKEERVSLNALVVAMLQDATTGHDSGAGPGPPPSEPAAAGSATAPLKARH